MALTKTQLREISRTLKVSEYPDYRAFLAALYSEAKRRDSSYSFVRLSDDLGLGSTNAHSVIHGRRPLTDKSAQRVCKELDLSGPQKRYFLVLVRQERARSAEDREAAFRERVDIKRHLLPSELSRSQLAFFEHWYHAVVLELLRLPDASDAPEWIADHLKHGVSLPLIKQSLELLVELGYLARDESRGRLFPTEVTISSGNEVRGIGLLSYHRQMIDLAVQALDQTPFQERDISAITVAVSEALRDQMKAEIVALRKRFLQLAAEEIGPGEIVQLNIQLFPLAGVKGSKA